MLHSFPSTVSDQNAKWLTDLQQALIVKWTHSNLNNTSEVNNIISAVRVGHTCECISRNVCNCGNEGVVRTFVDKLASWLMMKPSLAYKTYAFQLALQWIQC